MNASSTTKTSKKLSWLLRHGAVEAGVVMDAAGWVAIDDALAALKLSREELDAAVRDNNKSRFEVQGDRIRASQGHSIAGGPVSLDALEGTWEKWPGDGSVWHGTTVAAAHAIARGGIQPRTRTHVHLAEAVDSTVGKRAGVDVLLEVSPSRLRAAGIELYRSPNGVLLARSVPASCVVGVRGMTSAGQRAEDALRALFAGRG